MIDLTDVDRPELASVDEAVRQVGCTPMQIRNWIRRGHLQPERVEYHGKTRVVVDLAQVRDAQRDARDRKRGPARHAA